jgi:hypothetical protein
MKVKELKAILAQCDDEDDVIMASDAEGNSYHPLSADGVNTHEYNWDGEYYAEIGLRTLTPELEQHGYSEEDVMEGKPCVIFYP